MLKPFALALALALVTGATLTACGDRPGTEGSPPDPVEERHETMAPEFDFQQRMREISQDYFLLRPEVASYFGVPDEQSGEGTSSRLGSYSPVGEAQRRAGLKDILIALAAIPGEGLTPKEKFSLGLVETVAGNAWAPSEVVPYGAVLADYGVWFSPYPVSHLTGPHVEIPAMLEEQMAVHSADDAEAWLQRLETYASVLDEVIDKIAHDRELGVLPPDFVIDRTIDGLELFLEPPAPDHSLVAALGARLEEAAVDNPGAYTDRAVALLEDPVYPATRRLQDTLVALRAEASHEPGVGRLPNGAAFYQAMITHQTDTRLDAEEIHAIGLREVQRIEGEMDSLLKAIDRTEGTVGARMSVMLQDPDYLYENTPEGKARLMSDLQADLDLVNAKLPDWFGTLPDQAVEIRPVPPHREHAESGAFYDSPSLDGSRPGIYWISLADTATLPSYSLQTLTYHEANPGHHLQTVAMDKSRPILATVFFSNSSGEGWALYAEYLAGEMGIYLDDPVDDLGRLQAELYRAVRLVVDTGMHALGWGREQAIDYAVATMGIHVDEATNEIDRYAVWPGQALGYKLGMLKIMELRRRAEESLGKNFDIRAFHDALLEAGALPLNLLEEKIDAWIGEQAGTTG